MKKVKACVIIKNKAGEFLLQRRDEEPARGTWVLFGGSVQAGETEESALRREIKEELEFELGKINFFGRYQDSGINQTIFIAVDPTEFNDLILREGSEMKFFPAAGLQTLEIGFNFKEIINDYLTIKPMEDQKIEKIETLDYYALKAAESLSNWKYPEAGN